MFKLLNHTQVCINLFDELASHLKIWGMFRHDQRNARVEGLNIEQELSVAFRMCTGFGLPFCCGHTFFIFWSRLLGTGSQMYYSQVCQREKRVIASENIISLCFAVGGMKTMRGMLMWHDLRAIRVFVRFCFDLLSTLTCSHHLSTQC